MLLLLLPRLPAAGVSSFFARIGSELGGGRVEDQADRRTLEAVRVSTLRSDEKMPQAISMRRRKGGGEDKES